MKQLAQYGDRFVTQQTFSMVAEHHRISYIQRTGDFVFKHSSV